MSGISRRSFLTGTGLAAMGLAGAAALAGCAPEAPGKDKGVAAEEQVPAQKKEPTQTKEADVVVAGAGGGRPAGGVRCGQQGREGRRRGCRLVHGRHHQHAHVGRLRGRILSAGAGARAPHHRGVHGVRERGHQLPVEQQGAAQRHRGIRTRGGQCSCRRACRSTWISRPARRAIP